MICKKKGRFDHRIRQIFSGHYGPFSVLADHLQIIFSAFLRHDFLRGPLANSFNIHRIEFGPRPVACLAEGLEEREGGFPGIAKAVGQVVNVKGLVLSAASLASEIIPLHDLKPDFLPSWVFVFAGERFIHGTPETASPRPRHPLDNGSIPVGLLRGICDRGDKVSRLRSHCPLGIVRPGCRKSSGI